VIRVDRRGRIVIRRLGSSALLGGLRLWRRCKTGDLELELAPVTRGELRGPGIEWLAGNRTHGASLLQPPIEGAARSLIAHCDIGGSAVDLDDVGDGVAFDGFKTIA
jgi:hypothetical protein